jgi:hypothetical protein
LAVHHFKAADFTVAVGWQPIDTFPQDGQVYEIREGEGPVSKATWVEGRLHVSAEGTHNPTQWRQPE